MRKRAVKVGITGSIGMGKTTVALEISKHSYPVWNADQAVHSLYKVGNEGYRIIKELAPRAVIGSCVDRDLLAKILFKKPGLIKTIENRIHPLVDKNRKDFLKQHKNKQKPFPKYDISTKMEPWGPFGMPSASGHKNKCHFCHFTLLCLEVFLVTFSDLSE